MRDADDTRSHSMPSAWLRRLWFLALLSPLGMLILVAIGGLSPPRMDVVGCNFFRGDGSCQQAAGTEPLRLWLDISPDADVTIWHGLRKLETNKYTKVATSPTRGVLVTIAPTQFIKPLSVHMRLPFAGFKPIWRWRLLRFTTRNESAWLRQAWQLFSSDHRQEALALLEQNRNMPQTAEEKARIKSLMAVIAIEDRAPNSLQLIEEAIEAFQQANLLSDALEMGLWLKNLLVHERFELSRAEAELHKLRPLFEQLPQWAPWESYALAEIAYLRGDPRGALEALSRGMEIAARTGNHRAQHDILRLQSVVYVAMGRLSDAKSRLDDAQSLPAVGPCRMFDLYRSLAQLELRWDEAFAAAQPIEPKRPLGPAYIANQQQALAYLTQALRLTEGQAGCSKPLFAAQALTLMAQLAAQRGDDALARTHIADAQRRLQLTGPRAAGTPSELSELRISWQVLLADADRRAKRFAEAEQQYMQLDTGQANFYDSSLWARTGQAQIALARGDIDAALAHYARAEAYLDERSLAMPLGAGQGGYLARYSPSTSLYVDLLLSRAEGQPEPEKQAWLAKALSVIRHARTRGLRGLLNVERLAHLQAAEKQDYEKSFTVYSQLRGELDTSIRQIWGGADSELRTKRQQQLLLAEKALLQLQTALSRLGFNRTLATTDTPDTTGTTPDSSPVPTGQALFTCFPLRADWACLLSSAEGIQVHRFPSLDMDAAREKLGSTLLDPFAKRLQAASLTKLRVVAYGPLREVDLHLLPFGPDHKPLWLRQPRLDVAYAADLPVIGQATPTGPTRQAFLLSDAHGNLPNLGRAAEAIATSLRSAGYSVENIRQPVPDHSGSSTEGPTPPVPLTTLLEKIGSVDLFHFGSHFNYQYSGGLNSHIPLPDQAGFSIGDLLQLPRVPRQVTLFGCNTGRSMEEVGNLETLGLAQTFLAKGSQWVVAGARPLNDGLAAGIAKAFYQHLSQHPDDPHEALRQAVLGTGQKPVQSHRALTPALDLGAYRVYEP